MRKKKINTYSKIFKSVLIIFLIIILVFLLLSLLEKRILPTVLKISNIQAVVLVNRAIDKAIRTTLTEKTVTSSDFISQQSDAQGRVNLVSANTVLINEICSRIAVEVSDELYALDNQEIKIHFGVLTGIETFESSGPKITVSIRPKGTALVDYKTHFESVGINQINFQVFIDIVANVTIIAPLQSEDIEIKRKVALVNTVLSGSVPNNIYQGNPFNTYPQKSNNGNSSKISNSSSQF